MTGGERIDTLERLYRSDLEFDRASAALLKAQADNMARGVSTNPAREQSALTKAALKRKEILKALIDD